MPHPRLTFLGAAGEVTGSCTLVETERARVLVDFGMFQGSIADERRNLEPPKVEGARLDAVLLTHAHVDHVGRVPLLGRMGYTGPILATEPTCELLGPVLRSSARVQQARRAEWREAHGARPGMGVRGVRRDRGAEPVGGLAPVRVFDEAAAGEEPAILYTEAEVEGALRRVSACRYGEPVEAAPGIRARFLDAGHVIGSASIELTIRHGGAGGGETVIVFSGDLGSSDAPLLPRAASPDHADVVVMESTYGGRAHPTPTVTLDALAGVVRAARRGRDRVIVPTFSIGRAQQVLWALGRLSEEGRLLGTPVYLDSKMAVIASEAYARFPDLLDAPAREAMARGRSPLQFPELHYILDRRDSMRLNRLHSGGIIVAGSGFCTGGPVVHHLVHALWRPDTRVVLVGYQAPGTPAAAIAAREPMVELNGRVVEVGATVHVMEGFSGHADDADLREWLGGIRRGPGLIVLNHGDESGREAMARAAEGFGVRGVRPGLGEHVEV